MTPLTNAVLGAAMVANALNLLSVSIPVKRIKNVGGTGAALMACVIQRAIVNTV